MPLPRILDLFDPDNLPNRELERTIQPDDPSTVYRDIQDYVLPPEVKEWLFDRPDSLVSQYLGSHSGVPDATCTWITGFFGSGKSHLLKVSGLPALEQGEVTDDAGHTFGATAFICDRLGVGNLATLITNQFSARPLIVQMLELCPRQLSRWPGILDQLHHPELARTLPGSITGPLDRPVRAILAKNNQYDHFCCVRRRDDGERRRHPAVGRDPQRRGACPRLSWFRVSTSSCRGPTKRSN